MRRIYEHPTVQQRFDFLKKTEDQLNHRTDIKMQLWCGKTSKELSTVQERVFAQLYGIRNWSNDTSNMDRLFRWLMAHTGETRYDFRLKKATHYQWPKMIGRYFQNNGYYAELAVLEKILLTILRSRTPLPISDVLLADRVADRWMKTDWIFHRKLPQGDMQIWIQVSTVNHVIGKVGEILRRPISDIPVFDQASSSMVKPFLRHVTGVIAFPLFQSADAERDERRDILLGWSRTYQSRLVKEQNEGFENYGRWIMEIIEVFDEGIRDRTIDRFFSHKIHDLTYKHPAKNGNMIQITHTKIHGEQVVILEFFRIWAPKKQSRPIIFALPLQDDFLNMYRDKLGVRAY